MILDFTTTAMARPPIFEKTYQSFTKNLKGVDFKKCTLYLNVDPFPKRKEAIKVVTCAQRYFGKVVYNISETANFSQAINWCWSNAKSKYIFHLEDDWVLTKPIHIDQLLKYFILYPELYEVALRAYPYIYKTCVLSPSLLHKRYYKAIAGNLRIDTNPEIQLRGEKFGLNMPRNYQDKKAFSDVKIVIFPKKRIVVKDIGRKWFKRTKFKKPKKKGKFITWIT